MQKYTVQINKDNYFSVDSKIIEFRGEIVRIVNLRSVSGIIGEKFDISDSKLKEIIRHYLIYSNNVELLNIYSRKLNEFNWFEIYSNSESSEKQAQNEQFGYPNSSKTNEKIELSEYIKISDQIDESKINSELKDSKNQLIPSKLYEKLNSIIPKFQKINLESLNFVPIWHINGSPQTNAKYCELFTTFEILIHILSKRFISFKSELLSLSSTEIQNSVARGIKINDYTNMKKNSLKQLILQKDDKIDELNRKIDSMMIEMRGQSTKIDNQLEEIGGLKIKIDDQKEEISGLNKKIDNQTEEISGQKEEISNLNKKIDKQSGTISSLESKIIGGLSVLQQIKNTQDLTCSLIQKTNQNQIQFLENEVPPSAVGMKQTEEITIFIYSPKLQQEIINSLPDLKLNHEDLILDTISCQTKDLKSHLIKHKYYEIAKGNKKSEDEVITYRLTCNSLDLNKFAQRFSVSSNLLDGKGKFIRKFIVNKSKLDLFKKEFNDFVDSLEENHRKTIELLKDSSSIASNYKNSANELIDKYIQEDFYDKDEIKNTTIKAQIEYLTRTVKEIKNNQEDQSKEIKEIKNNQLVMMNLLTSLNPKIKNFQIKLDHYYYDVINENNQAMYATKRSKDGKFSEFQPLTIELFNKSIFRDKDHVRDIYLPSKRKAIE